MEAVLAEILGIAASALTDAPTVVADTSEVITIVENAVAAFKAGDQASLDTAHKAAIALAQPLAPAGDALV